METFSPTPITPLFLADLFTTDVVPLNLPSVHLMTISACFIYCLHAVRCLHEYAIAVKDNAFKWLSETKNHFPVDWNWWQNNLTCRYQKNNGPRRNDNHPPNYQWCSKESWPLQGNPQNYTFLLIVHCMLLHGYLRKVNAGCLRKNVSLPCHVPYGN